MLDEQCFIIETVEGTLPASLPEALAFLCSGRLLGFDGVAAHQRHALFLFLCQLAGLALILADEEHATEDDDAWVGLDDAQAWRRRLAALTPTCAETAWSLVVDNPAESAFLQPPILQNLDRYEVIGRTPDEIDLLVTAKAHDLKPARAGRPEARHWIFALISLQTQQGYSGRGNFGIARMNGGFASRPMLMLTPGQDLPARFRRGVQAALAARHTALDRDNSLFRDQGKALLWLEPWDIEISLPLRELDPLFIEVCRRIRLKRSEPGGQIVAYGRSSEVQRVDAKAAKGNLGDAWTPIAVKDGAALTVAAGGFDYRRLQSVIATEDFIEPEALKTRKDDPEELWLHAAVLVRGQGKTEGFHERWLRMPADMRKPEGTRTSGKISRAMIADADGARMALRIALLTFLQGGPDKLDFKDERPRVWLDALEHKIDGIFFTYLFTRLPLGTPESEAGWQKDLGRKTRALFEEAIERLTAPENRRERARARASFTFNGLMRKAGLMAVPNMPEEEEAAI